MKIPRKKKIEATLTPAADERLHGYIWFALAVTEALAEVTPDLFLKISELALRRLEQRGHDPHELKASLSLAVQMSKNFDLTNPTGRAH